MAKDRHFRAVPGSGVTTGGRTKEIFGLLVRDINTKNDVVHIRPNRYRDQKPPTTGVTSRCSPT